MQQHEEWDLDTLGNWERYQFDGGGFTDNLDDVLAHASPGGLANHNAISWSCEVLEIRTSPGAKLCYSNIAIQQ